MKSPDKVTLFAYYPKQRESFRSGKLWKNWRRQYPNIFDEHDEQLARAQASLGYHFYEWLAAIVIFHTTGWLSLVEKYQFRNHGRKQAVLDKLGAADVIHRVGKVGTQKRAQFPDLLVYKSDYSDWCFYEVKGERDQFRMSQEYYFKKIRRLTGKSISIIRFHPEKG